MTSNRPLSVATTSPAEQAIGAATKPATNVALNVAIVGGTIVNDVIRRDLPGGSVVVQFDLSTRVVRDGREQSVSVPVAWHDPLPSADAFLLPGHGVVVLGRIERRFFRSGGLTQSRTELVVERCVPVRRTKSVRSLLAAAAAVLESAPEPGRDSQ